MFIYQVTAHRYKTEIETIVTTVQAYDLESAKEIGFTRISEGGGTMTSTETDADDLVLHDVKFLSRVGQHDDHYA